ncbi:MAG: hypothetical protein WDM79_14080 [Terricaulis sp.]
MNSLDSALLLTVDEGTGPEVLVIPNSNVRVEENRSEFFAVHTWRPDEHWTLETRIARESSTLTFTGDANQETELSFWKPSVQLSHTFGESNQLRIRYYRDVGQLNFDDFVSAAAISDNLIDGRQSEPAAADRLARRVRRRPPLPRRRRTRLCADAPRHQRRQRCRADHGDGA